MSSSSFFPGAENPVVNGGTLQSANEMVIQNFYASQQASSVAINVARQQYELVKENKERCKILIQRCQNLLNMVTAQIEHEGLQDSMLSNIYTLESVCISVKDIVIQLASQSFAQRLLRQDQIDADIKRAESELLHAITLFQISSQAENARLQREIADSMAAAAAKDQSELVAHLANLSQNDNKILNSLEENHIRVEELLVALAKQIQNITINTSSQQFMQRAVGAIQKKSKTTVGKVSVWQVTSLEVTFDRKDSESQIGQGSFGTVFKGQWHGEIVAVKEMYIEDARSIDRKTLKSVHNEIEIWSSLTHPRVVQFYGACLEAERPFIVSRFCSNGNIVEFLKKNPSEDRLKLLHHISLGMTYLHNLSIIHADLKGANILIDSEGKALISDFGISQFKEKTGTTSTNLTGREKAQGTLRWMAPELLYGEVGPDLPGDVYAFGITAWEVYTLEVPFSNIPQHALFPRVYYGRERPKCPPIMNGELVQLVNRCWAHEIVGRPNFRSVSTSISTIIAQWEKSTVQQITADNQAAVDKAKREEERLKQTAEEIIQQQKVIEKAKREEEELKQVKVKKGQREQAEQKRKLENSPQIDDNEWNILSDPQDNAVITVIGSAETGKSSTEIGTDNALAILGPGTVDSRVRALAVRQLTRVDDDELLLYLLQLIQALKFENSARSMTSAISYDDSGLTDFLIVRGVKNSILGNRLYWYLMVEVALEDRVMAKMYGRVVFKFMNKILEAENGYERREIMRRQGLVIDTLAKCARELRTSKDPRSKKIEKLRSILADSKNGLASMAPLPLPLNARIEVTGIIADKSLVFKSNLYPILLCFRCSDGSEYPVIFKDGDDTRQDQLVIQLFTLMDRLLRKENLDLKLSLYDVLATGPLQGMAQFIPGKTIAAIVSEHRNLLNYLRSNNRDEGSVGTFGVEPSVFDTFVRSCAGYCVITYLLGVGDRRLDTVLVASDGHFFHVDSKYILSRDLKSFSPLVKVFNEMVDGMGGVQSLHYARFKNFCFTAFAILRKSANLILNLVALMVNADIPDIKHRDVHEQIQAKFRLGLTEEEAIKHFESMLNEMSYLTNERSHLTVVLDRIQDFAQYWHS